MRGTVVRPDGTALPDAAVLVEGDRIVRVGRASEIATPGGARVVGGPDAWIVPGPFDAHVHFFQSGGLYTRPDIVDLTARVPYADERAAIRAALDRTLARYLRCGVTSVVDMGGPLWNFDVREHARRSPLAPRVRVAGPAPLLRVPPAARPRRPAHPRGEGSRARAPWCASRRRATRTW